MKWREVDQSLVSDCGIFRITNEGSRGGKKYRLDQWDTLSRTYCRFKHQGTLDECRGYFDDRNDLRAD
jgi:hypothetical protein